MYKTAVALGLFDGVHLGHREVIKYPVKLSELGFTPSVFTFKNTTLSQKQGRPFEYIYSDFQKSEILKNLGIKQVFEEDFNKIRNMSGEEFVSEILVKKLNAKYVICGRDFKFGHNAACGLNELIALGRTYGFAADVAEDIKIDGESVSSNKIRSLLSDGYIVKAAELLGDDYFIHGEIVHGNQIGRTLQFPTINQYFENGQLVPKYGVYASQTKIDGEWINSVTNVGIKPTIAGARAPLAETHIIGYSGDLYGKPADVRLKKFIRSEMKFSSLDELKEAMSMDIGTSIRILDRLKKE